jgi:hypothetical protein
MSPVGRVRELARRSSRQLAEVRQEVVPSRLVTVSSTLETGQPRCA